MRFIGKFNIDWDRLGQLKKSVGSRQISGGMKSLAKPVIIPIPSNLETEFGKVFMNQGDADSFFNFYKGTNLTPKMVAKIKDSQLLGERRESPHSYDRAPDKRQYATGTPYGDHSLTQDELLYNYVYKDIEKSRRPTDETLFDTILRYTYNEMIPVGTNNNVNILPTTVKTPDKDDIYDYLPKVFDDYQSILVNPDPLQRYIYGEIQPAIDTKGFKKDGEEWQRRRGVRRLTNRYLGRDTYPDTNPANWLVSNQKRLLSFDPIVPSRPVLNSFLQKFY